MEFVTKYNRGPDEADTATCVCCGRKIDLNYDDYCVVGDGDIVCDHCKSSVTTCERCGAEILRDDARTGRDGICLCEYCWDDLYVTC